MTENDPLLPSEYVLRRIPNNKQYYDPTLIKPVVRHAMGPTRDDIDGLSLFREAFVSAEDVALSGRSLSGYYVARIQVQEILNIGLSVIPDPQTELPGHSLIPELNTARKKTDKNAVKEFQVQLADLASRDIIYTPISK